VQIGSFGRMLQRVHRAGALPAPNTALRQPREQTA